MRAGRKTYRIKGKVYRTRDEAHADMFACVWSFYNAVRRHSIVGYIGPVEFENKAVLA